MKKIAMVMTPTCPKAKRRFGVRVEKIGTEWYATWAFSIPAKSHENFTSNVSMKNSSFSNKEGFPGCPHCGSDEMLKCGSCNSFYCYHGETTSTCPVCGNTGTVEWNGWDSISGGGY